MSKEDTQFSIGKLHAEHYERDAIHFAVMPVMAGEGLKPGQHIGFTDGGYQVTAAPAAPYKTIGIVDPFLPKPVKKGERFWMVLYPNTITGLKHVWSHPAISNDGRGVGTESEKWLRDFAECGRCRLPRDDAMIAGTHCEGHKGYGDYLIEGGKWEGQGTPEEFWSHFSNVTGKKPNMWKDDAGKEHGPGIFSCSC